jgi:cytidyltransferase-like protein
MYLERARRFGDFLIVGVDSDAKIRERKGDERPLVPETERLEMLTYQRSVGAVFLKRREHKTWTLIKNVRPNVLVVTADTYTTEEIKAIESRFGCEVKVLQRMAMVSTSGRLRAAQLGEGALSDHVPLPGLDSGG